jgi:tripartite ATP-independent transporter DctM subunit
VSVELAMILMFASLLVLLATGLPVAFAMGAVSLLFGYFLWGPQSLIVIATSAFSVINSFALLAIPLFIFMANVLQDSGVADDLFTMMHKWFGSLNGGLAMGTVLICTVFAAMSGVSAAATISMGLIALPAMLKRGYDKKIAVGSISAAGGLGQLIPPSVMMIIWSLLAQESVGQMFLGGVIPGLILSSLFIIYIGVRCSLQRDLGPSIPPEERLGWKEKFISLRAIALPVFLIVVVLGSIFSGMATPTESAVMGSIGSLVCSAVYRRLTWLRLQESVYRTLRLTVMIGWIITAGTFFSSVFIVIGGQQLVIGVVQSLGVNPWIILVAIQIIYLVLGCMLDINAIMLISIPIFVPLVKALGFESLWFGVLSIVNIEMGFITPPFGMNLFFMRSIVPENVTMIDIYRSVIPFVILQMVGLVICMILPQTILYLPNLVLGE